MKKRILGKRLENIFYILLNELSEKFDNKILRDISNFLFIIVEKIALKLDNFLNFYIQYYDDMIEREIKLGSISNSDKLVNVGCGSIPASLILITQKTGANAVGIDKDRRVVEDARVFIDHLDLSDKIEIKNAEASDFVYQDFDVIVISHGVRPIDRFLRYLSDKIPKDSRVILRTFSDKTGNLDESEKTIRDLFQVNKIAAHKRQGRVISVLLTMKK